MILLGESHLKRPDGVFTTSAAGSYHARVYTAWYRQMPFSHLSSSEPLVQAYFLCNRHAQENLLKKLHLAKKPSKTLKTLMVLRIPYEMFVSEFSTSLLAHGSLWKI